MYLYICVFFFFLFHLLVRLFSLVAYFGFSRFIFLVFCSLYFSAHMYISSIVQRE
jgi:hypothetical protein